MGQTVVMICNIVIFYVGVSQAIYDWLILVCRDGLNEEGGHLPSVALFSTWVILLAEKDDRQTIIHKFIKVKMHVWSVRMVIISLLM